jgi:hypothetical protein
MCASCDTYTDRKYGSHFVHGVAVGSLTDVCDFIHVSGQGQLLVNELSKGPHPIGTAADAHKLHGGDREAVVIPSSMRLASMNQVLAPILSG